MWKGSISFGLVNIPIKMFAATEDKDIKFRYIHNKCKTPIKYEKVCPACKTEITQDDIVRGFEYEPGKFVVIDNEDINALKQSTGKAIEILDFVNLSDIDPVYFVKTYYLSPQETGGKAYNLLREAMNRTGKIAVAKITLRDKQSLAAIRVYKNLLAMETIFYPDEVRDSTLVPNIPAEEDINDKELTMAIQLIENLSDTFNPEKYTDEYRHALRELINKKIEGDEVVIRADEPKHNVIDLMEALQESLKQTERIANYTESPPKPKIQRKKKETAK